MLKYIIALILFLPAQVWGGVFVGFGQQASGGTLLAGTNSVTVSAWSVSTSQGAHFDGLYTAAQSGTLAKGYANLRTVDNSRACKMLVWNSSGAIVATSNAVTAPTTATDVEFTFSSGSITASSQYYLGTICNQFVERGHDNISWNGYHEANNYTTPTNITAPPSGNASFGNLRVWVIN